MSASLGGSRVAHYSILGAIGSSRSGRLYRARDDRTRRDVLIKFLSAEADTQRESHLRFRREAQIVACLNHPNIITILEYAETGGIPYMVFEGLEGEWLSDALRRRVPLREGIPVVGQVLAGLEYLHRMGGVHRSLDPSGVFVCAHGRVKITDFSEAEFAAPLQRAGGSR